MSGGGSWKVIYADSVIDQDIPSLDHATGKRIKHAIESKLVTDPIHFGKPLRYSLHHLRSLRVGDYRVLYHVEREQHTVSVVSIGHRRNIYS